MSGNARNFNNIETRAVIKFFFSARQGAEGNSRHSERNIRGTCSIACHWVARFKRSDFSTCDAPRPGRPKTVTTPEIIDQIHELILEDRRILAKSIAEQLGISHEQVGSIIHEGLDLRKLSANVNSASRLSNFWNFFCMIQMIFCRARLVTMDKTWLYHYDPQTKQQSMEWQKSGSPHPKKFRVQKSTGKVLASIFRIKKASSFIIFQRAKLSMRRIIHLCWRN